MAYKVFTNGSTLQASELNENLMQQSIAVFSNASARTAAITSPVEGQMTWLEDVNAYQYWNGTAWVSAALGTGSGLVHLSTQTVSAVTAINFNNVFSSSYRNYRVVVNGASTTRNDLQARLRVGGVDATGSNYLAGAIYRDQLAQSSYYATQNAANIGYLETGNSTASVEISNPFQASNTSFASVSAGVGTNGILWLAGTGHNLSTSYDGISILSTNAFTGQVSVYGYRN